MEEGHVVDAQGLGDRGVVLVARASDRVETLAARLQPAREPVHLAAGHLAVEELDHRFAGETDFGRPNVAGPPGQVSVPDPGDELLMNGFGGVHGAPTNRLAMEWEAGRVLT